MLDLRTPRELFLLGTALSLSALVLFVTIQTHLVDPTLDSTRTRVQIFDVSEAQLDGVIPTESVQTETAGRNRERRLPHAIIIGTRKSGTRALARFLEINPSIRSAHTEVHFFDRLQNYRLGLEWYRSQMPLTSEDQLTIEKSPAYFVTSNVPERIRAMNASIKLIVIMRDPVTRLVSDFSQLFAHRMESIMIDYDKGYYETSDVDEVPRDELNIENKTVDLQEAGKELERHVLRSDGGIDDQRRIVRTGMYAMHLERWISVFPREQFHFVNGEQLIKEPHVELQKLELFLGFKKPKIMKEHFVFIPRKGFYCLVGEGLTRDKRQTEAIGTIDKGKLNKPVCLGKSKGRRHVSIGGELSDKLRNFYAPYNEYLLSLTGLNFT